MRSADFSPASVLNLQSCLWTDGPAAEREGEGVRQPPLLAGNLGCRERLTRLDNATVDHTESRDAGEMAQAEHTLIQALLARGYMRQDEAETLHKSLQRQGTSGEGRQAAYAFPATSGQSDSVPDTRRARLSLAFPQPRSPTLSKL